MSEPICLKCGVTRLDELLEGVYSCKLCGWVTTKECEAIRADLRRECRRVLELTTDYNILAKKANDFAKQLGIDERIPRSDKVDICYMINDPDLFFPNLGKVTTIEVLECVELHEALMQEPGVGLRD